MNEIIKGKSHQATQIGGWKCLFVKQNRTEQYPVGRDHKPLGYYEQRCKYCQSIRTSKHGKAINQYQRCSFCKGTLGIPSSLKTQHRTTIKCEKCEKSNDIKYEQRWHCADCGVTFIRC